MSRFLLTAALLSCRASARTVTAIIPYYGYSRQDEKRRPRVPIAASDIAMLMEAAGVDKVLSVDLHSGQIQGQFQHCPVDNLSMFEDFAAFFVKHLLPTFPEGSEVAVVSPDADGTARAKFFLSLLIERGAWRTPLWSQSLESIPPRPAHRGRAERDGCVRAMRSRLDS